MPCGTAKKKKKNQTNPKTNKQTKQINSTLHIVVVFALLHSILLPLISILMMTLEVTQINASITPVTGGEKNYHRRKR